jgi:putative heme transporter
MASKIKKNFKFWLNVITIAALLILVVISWDQIIEAFRKLDSLNTWALLFMIPMQLVSYYAVARFYFNFFKAKDEQVSFKSMYAVALELNFVNHVFPSGGVSGFSYLSLRLKQFGISTSKSTLAQLLRFALTFISFLVLLFIGMVVLSFGKNTNPLIILISSTIVFATIFGVAVGVYIISDKRRIKAFVSWLPKALNRLVRLFRRNKGAIIDMEKVEKTLDDLHEDYLLLRQDRLLIKQMLGWALLINIAELLTIYLVYVAFGNLINPGALIIAYAVANFAGLIAVLPGGVGIYEGLMTAVLAIYRVLCMVYFLPVGYYLYNRALKHSGNQLNVSDHDAPTLISK